MSFVDYHSVTLACELLEWSRDSMVGRALLDNSEGNNVPLLCVVTSLARLGDDVTSVSVHDEPLALLKSVQSAVGRYLLRWPERLPRVVLRVGARRHS